MQDHLLIKLNQMNFLVLISRWENILQKITDSFNKMKIYEELKKETDYLREQLANLDNSTSSRTSTDENEDLETRMQNTKVKCSKSLFNLTYHTVSD